MITCTTGKSNNLPATDEFCLHPGSTLLSIKSLSTTTIIGTSMSSSSGDSSSGGSSKLPLILSILIPSLFLIILLVSIYCIRRKRTTYTEQLEYIGELEIPIGSPIQHRRLSVLPHVNHTQVKRLSSYQESFSSGGSGQTEIEEGPVRKFDTALLSPLDVPMTLKEPVEAAPPLLNSRGESSSVPSVDPPLALDSPIVAATPILNLGAKHSSMHSVDSLHSDHGSVHGSLHESLQINLKDAAFTPPAPTSHVAIDAYVARRTDELSFAVGDLIGIEGPVLADGWAFGSRSNGLRGFFCLGLVKAITCGPTQIVDLEGRRVKGTTSNSSTPIPHLTPRIV